MEAPSGGQTKVKAGKQRLGDLLVAQGLVDDAQLRQALRRQAQVGGHIGSILIELGAISIDALLAFLSEQTGFPSIDLYTVNIDPATLALVPLEKIRRLNVLPVAADENTVTLAMVNPHDYETVSEIGFSIGRKVKPVVVPAFMLEGALKLLLHRAVDGLEGAMIAQVITAQQEKVGTAPTLEALLEQFAASGADDLLLTAGVPPSLKASNSVSRLAMAPLTPVDCEVYGRKLLSPADWETFLNNRDHDFAINLPPAGRFRVNIYRQRNSVSIAIRRLPEQIADFRTLGLPEWVREFALKLQGLILVSGPAGHGKSTTLASLVDLINSHRKCNIVTFEDPVEYLHVHKLSNINQREVGRDTASFYEGLRHVFRQTPDVIVIGEMRDKESFEIALKAANTGHLVMSTAHARNATAVIESTINMFEPHRQGLIRAMLADSLLLSLSQRLVPRKDGKGRVLALEKLINSHRIKKRIREEQTHHIRSQMQAGSEDFTSLDVALVELCKRGLIRFDDGLLFAEDKSYFQDGTGFSRA